ncbi:MAG TPA: 50S ribosomal protein L11 methyltransferase [Saprospiraceae bacterium]|nr:50S ribosomal protein L11 methyltransferase [Saprospiraceae bacterium]
MKPEYYALRFDMGDHDPEIWLARLSEWPFESFHEEGNVITGYIHRHDIREDMMQFISGEAGVSFEDYEMNQVPDQNWNQVWESSFNPVAVDDYCYIHAVFHGAAPKAFKHEVVIAPRMAFGTGHHATTYMMLQAMSGLLIEGKRVLDFGCGTGILSVVAAMEGAVEVIGIDIQPEAIENSEEHAVLNHVSPVCHFYLGDLSLAGSAPYDFILANINRNVILQNFMALDHLLKPGGELLISGIMFDDVTMVKEELLKHELQITAHRERDQWVQMTVKKTSP